MGERIIEAFVNPLLWIDATPQFAGDNIPTAESALNYLTLSNKGTLKIEDIRKNYSQIAVKANRLPIVPAEARLLMKMIFPLKNAMGCYMLGNYVESIGISGMVAEMATIFLFEISDIDKDGKAITSARQRIKASTDIDWLPQSQRTDRLFKYGLITDDTKIRLDCVSNQRNKYLHRLSASDKDVNIIAKNVFESTLEILVSITGFKIGSGKVLFDPKVLDYLKKQESKKNQLSRNS